MTKAESEAWMSETIDLDGVVFLGSGPKTVEKPLIVWSIL